MVYDYKNELEAVKQFYQGDKLQKRFSALICGEIGAGKTFSLRTARKPVHIDSFDPGGTKCLRDEIEAGDIIADTSYEHEDPFNPTAWERWVKRTNIRFEIGYYEHFGTYALDYTKWQDAAMNFQLKNAGQIGKAPRHRYDYNPTKVLMQNLITKLMNLPCDFILLGHFRMEEELLSIDSSTGIERKKIEYRFLTIGQASTTIPLMFDEIYVLKTEETSSGLSRVFLLEPQDRYPIVRSRLRANNKLNGREPANIKALLKKIGLAWEDKEKLNLEKGE